jgi:hypothetical protein
MYHLIGGCESRRGKRRSAAVRQQVRAIRVGKKPQEKVHKGDTRSQG